MDNQIIIISILVGLLVISVFMEINNRRKITNRIKAQWGSWPRQKRIDSEKSLKKAYEQIKTTLEKKELHR